MTDYVEFAQYNATPPIGMKVATENIDGKEYQAVILADTSANTVPVVTGANTGVKGLRVYGGPTDVVGDLPVVIDYDHHQIHEGETFRWSVYTASLGNGVNKDIRFVVPNITIPAGVNPVARCPHFRFEVVSSDLCNIYLYETPTFTGNGSQRTPVAMERNGTYTPKLQVWEDPTITVVGTQIFQGLLLTTKNNAGALGGSFDEFILKNNTEYAFRATSGAAGNKVLMRFVWYEDLGL